MYIVIKIYIAICVLLLAFDIVFLFVKNLKTSSYYPKNIPLEKEIQEALSVYETQGVFPEGFEKSLCEKLRYTKNLITLEKLVLGAPQTLQLFRDMVLQNLDAYLKKGDDEQAYYAYMVSLFDYSVQKVPHGFASRFLTLLDSKSLYTFSNAMGAIYAFGETNLLLMALDKIQEREGFYHKKLLVDGLLDSKANFRELNKKLLERFDRFTPAMQDSLLDYLRMNGHNISALCTGLMQAKNTETQVRYSAMRYFIKNPTEQSREMFLDILEEGGKDWVAQMLSIQALGAYNDPQVRRTIKTKVTDPNWYIRVNAIVYLHDHGLGRGEVLDILQLKDRYANDALLYQFHDDAEMTRYIIDTVQLLDAQQKPAAGTPIGEPLPV